MTNKEFFEYLKVLGKLPYISDEVQYKLLLEHKISLKNYYRVYSKIQENITYNDGINRFIESSCDLLLIIPTQEDFDRFVKGLDDVINMYLSYSKDRRFLSSLELNYINVLRHVSSEMSRIDILLKAFRIIVSPEYATIENKIYGVRHSTKSPVVHFDLRRNDEIIENVGMITYKNGEAKIHKIKNSGSYKECLLELRDKIKKNEIDFGVCGNRLQYGDIRPLYRVILTDCEIQ